jgi:hypothetical protein
MNYMEKYVPSGSQRDVVYLGWPIAPSYIINRLESKRKKEKLPEVGPETHIKRQATLHDCLAQLAGRWGQMD